MNHDMNSHNNSVARPGPGLQEHAHLLASKLCHRVLCGSLLGLSSNHIFTSFSQVLAQSLLGARMGRGLLMTAV